jgi:hypothetical protein
MAKEAYVYGKRGLCIWQKRPMYIAEEAYLCDKRGLLTVHICHIIIHTYVISSYAAYLCDKRGLLTVAYRNVRHSPYVTSSDTYVTSSYAYKAYLCDKRGLLTVAYRNVRRSPRLSQPLCIWQCAYGKRGLFV